MRSNPRRECGVGVPRLEGLTLAFGELPELMLTYLMVCFIAGLVCVGWSRYPRSSTLCCLLGLCSAVWGRRSSSLAAMADDIDILANNAGTGSRELPA